VSYTVVSALYRNYHILPYHESGWAPARHAEARREVTCNCPHALTWKSSPRILAGPL